MASKKQRRKETKRSQQAKTPKNGPFKHPDGDRRRRDMGMTVKQALEIKRMQREGELPPGPPTEEK